MCQEYFLRFPKICTSSCFPLCFYCYKTLIVRMFYQVIYDLCIESFNRRCGKICWVKHSRFQSHQTFQRNTFAFPWSEVSIFNVIKERCLYSWKAFMVLLKTVKNVKTQKNAKVQPSKSFHIYGTLYMISIFLNVLLECTKSFNTVHCISIYAEICRRVPF